MSESRKPASAADRYRFDTRDVRWRNFITDGAYYALLNVDLEARQADMLVKFDANCQCLYHRHTARTTSLVLEGELHVREQTPDGEVVTVKPAGTYSVGGQDEIHIEGAGDAPAVIYFSMLAEGDSIYQLLNPDLSLRRDITLEDFYRDWQEHWLQDQAA